MSFSDPSERFRDILDNIERIERHTAGLSCDAFENDATDTGCRGAVPVAYRRGRDQAGPAGHDRQRALCPTIPRADIRDIGNHLRHAYDAIETDEIRTSSATTSRPCGPP
jgi:uncharacterized protein with HEPN domain